MKLYREFRLKTLADWQAAAQQWVSFLKASDWIALEGAMGIGKTLAVRATLRAMGYEEAVPSPTYPLMVVHEVHGQTILHIDAYRLQGEEPWDFREWRDEIVFVEWSEKTSLPRERFQWIWKIRRTDDSGDSEERTLEMWRQAR